VNQLSQPATASEQHWIKAQMRSDTVTVQMATLAGYLTTLLQMLVLGAGSYAILEKKYHFVTGIEAPDHHNKRTSLSLTLHHWNYLFIYGLFNDAVSSPRYTASNSRTFNK
jgi:hypothetical protein